MDAPRSPATDGDDRPTSALPEPATVHTSLRGLAAAAITPLILLSLGGGAMLAGGLRWLPLLLVVAGVVLGAIVVLDVPRRTVFDGEGITRVCLARRQSVAWNRIVAIERSRPTTAAAVRNLTERSDDRVVSGGLVARGRRHRRWLLSDHVESRAEYDQLAGILEHPAVHTSLRAARPHVTAPPTDLYRRRKRAGT